MLSVELAGIGATAIGVVSGADDGIPACEDCDCATATIDARTGTGMAAADMLGVDVLGVDVLGVDVLGVDVLSVDVLSVDGPVGSVLTIDALGVALTFTVG